MLMLTEIIKIKIEMEKARRRQLSSLTHVKDSIIVPNSEQRDVEHGKAIELAAKKVGLSKGTFWKARRINPRLPYPLFSS